VREFFRNQWDRLLTTALSAAFAAAGYVLVLDAFYTQKYPHLLMPTSDGLALVARPDELSWINPWLVPGLLVIALGVAVSVAYVVYDYRKHPGVHADGLLRTEWRALLGLANWLLAAYAAWVAIVVIHFVPLAHYFSDDNVVQSFVNHNHRLLMWGLRIACLLYVAGLGVIALRHELKWPCAHCQATTKSIVGNVRLCPGCQQIYKVIARAEIAVKAAPPLDCPFCGERMVTAWVKTDGEDFVIYYACSADETEVYPHGGRARVIEYVDP
jgi:hypothetical protein